MRTTNHDDKEIWIFLSHSNLDFAKVRLIRNYLEEHSCRPLMFYLKCLSNDEEINELIKREIDCRTKFIICESENSQASKWVQSEVDYIKSQHRAYETINLDKSEKEIKSQLDNIIKSTQIFISYSPRDMEFVKSVYSHIRKYDIRCFFDVTDMPDGCDFAKEISYAIDLAKDFGFVVFFASYHSFSSKFVLVELQQAISMGAKLLILLLDGYAKVHYKEVFPNAQNILIDESTDRSNEPIKVRDLTVAKTIEEMMELAIEKIVDRAFFPWAIYTMAQNFLEGIDCSKDEEEANRLFGIAYRKADAFDCIGHPGGTLFVARCKAKGYGTERNLKEALYYYEEYIRICGSNDNINKEVNMIKQELNQRNELV